MQRLARLSRLRPALSPLETANHAAMLRRGILNARRGVSWSPDRPGLEATRYQRVRFVKPKHSWLRRLFPWITFAVVLYISDIISVEVEEEDEEDEEDEDMGKNEEAEGGRIVLGSFIPIPFSERLNPSRVPLPESQIALLNKLKNDQDFCHTLRQALADSIVDEVFRPGWWVRETFGNWISWNSYINVNAPTVHHPQWSQEGFALTDNGWYRARKYRLNNENIQLLRMLRWPAHVAGALWRYTTTVTTQTSRYLVGLPITPPPPPSRRAPGVLANHDLPEQRAQRSSSVKPQPPGGPYPGPPTTDHSKDGGGTVAPSESRHYSADATGNNDQGDGAPRRKVTGYVEIPALSLNLPVMTMRDIFPTAWNRLMFELAHIGWMPRPHPPSGCLELKGSISVYTGKYVVNLWLLVYYMPGPKEFHTPSAMVAVKDWTPI